MSMFGKIISLFGGGAADEEENPLPQEKEKPAASFYFNLEEVTGKTPIVLRVMTVADGHGRLSCEEVKTAMKEYEAKTGKSGDFDFIFFLGDNTPDDIEVALHTWKKTCYSSKTKFFGIVGNHDSKNLLRETDVEDLHGKVQFVYNEDGAVTIGGFGGCAKYKDESDRLLLTETEQLQIAESLKQCDILLAHDKPNFETPSDEQNDAHRGMTGLGFYIEHKFPKIVLHGHLHERSITKHWGTAVKCCYRVECFDLPLPMQFPTPEVAIFRMPSESDIMR